MEKMKVTKWVFESLEKERVKLKNKKVFQDKMLENIYKGNSIDAALGQYSNNYLAKCIMYGYELEETKEQKLLKIYENHDQSNDYSEGIKKAVEILGFKIEGIN